MRRAARVDANQRPLCELWTQMGGTVLYLHYVGQGAPDTLLGMASEMELAEFKAEDGELSERQMEWRRWWRGRPPRLIRTEDDLLRLAEEMRQRAHRRSCAPENVT